VIVACCPLVVLKWRRKEATAERPTAPLVIARQTFAKISQREAGDRQWRGLLEQAAQLGGRAPRRQTLDFKLIAGAKRPH